MPPIFLNLGNPKLDFTINGTHLVCSKLLDEDPFLEMIAGMNSLEFEENVYKPLNYTMFPGTILSFSDINILARHLKINRPIYSGSLFLNLKVGSPETEFNVSRQGLKFLSNETMKFHEIPRLKFEEISNNNLKNGVKINGIKLSREEMNRILDLMDLVTHYRKH